MKRFCLGSLCSYLNVLTAISPPVWGMLRRLFHRNVTRRPQSKTLTQEKQKYKQYVTDEEDQQKGMRLTGHSCHYWARVLNSRCCCKRFTLSVVLRFRTGYFMAGAENASHFKTLNSLPVRLNNVPVPVQLLL